jgi:hypothetical protein
VEEEVVKTGHLRRRPWREMLTLVCLVLGMVGCDKYVADQTIGAAGFCELHSIRMAKTNVPIIYGLIRLNKEERAREVASTNHFPHADTYFLGGCILGTPTQAVLYVCSDCLRARKNWEAAHATGAVP